MQTEVSFWHAIAAAGHVLYIQPWPVQMHAAPAAQSTRQGPLPAQAISQLDPLEQTIRFEPPFALKWQTEPVAQLAMHDPLLHVNSQEQFRPQDPQSPPGGQFTAQQSPGLQVGGHIPVHDVHPWPLTS